jgi:transcriptional regulator with XRE-family HTH domain
MGRRGPKAWVPSHEEIEKIKLYAGLGSTQKQVASLMGKSENTLANQPAAKEAFEQGKAQTIAKVAGTLVRKALEGDTASAIFYLKAQAGWRESSKHEVSGPGGGPLQFDVTRLSEDELHALASKG